MHRKVKYILVDQFDLKVGQLLLRQGAKWEQLGTSGLRLVSLPTNAVADGRNEQYTISFLDADGVLNEDEWLEVEIDLNPYASVVRYRKSKFALEAIG